MNAGNLGASELAVEQALVALASTKQPVVEAKASGAMAITAEAHSGVLEHVHAHEAMLDRLKDHIALLRSDADRRNRELLDACHDLAELTKSGDAIIARITKLIEAKP
jgi:hypothetical protein